MAKYNTITDPNSEFKYGLLYGNFDKDCTGKEYEQNSSPLMAQRIFEFARDNCIPISLGQTNPYGTCGVCNVYYKKVSSKFVGIRLKSPYLFLLLGHSNVTHGNKQYVDSAVGFNFQSALGHTYYYKNDEKGYVISIRANISIAPFLSNTYKSAEELAGTKKGASKGLKPYISKNKNPTNTFSFTDEWYLECAEYMLKGLVPDSAGRYADLPDYVYRFVEFLFRDYRREYQYENDYIKKYIDAYYGLAPENGYVIPTQQVIDPDVVIGGRNSDFEKARNCAAANGIPLFAVWTKVGCHFCTIFDQTLDNPAFEQWVKDTGIIMVYLKAKKDSDYAEACDWIRGDYRSFPFARVYWVKSENDIRSDRFIGRISSYGKNGKGGPDNLIAKIKNTIGDWKYEPPPEPTPGKGNGNINNAITGAKDEFITGQWYRYDHNTTAFQKLIDYANASGLPMIFVASQIGCDHCTQFMSMIQKKREMMDWYANSGCLLAYLFSGSGWWTSKDNKVFVDVIENGKGTGMPTIGVWRSGKILWQQTGYSSSQTVQKMQELFEDALAKTS